MTPSPLEILKEAIQAVPAVKFALGIAGIVAVVAIIRGFSISYRVAVFGAVVMVVLMTVLVTFVRLSTAGSVFFLWPAVVLTWFSLILIMATAGLLFSSVFFKRPIDLRRWLDPSLSTGVEMNPSQPPGGLAASTSRRKSVVIIRYTLPIAVAVAGSLFYWVFFRAPIDLPGAEKENDPIRSLGEQISPQKPDSEVLQAISALVQYSLAKPSAEQINSAVGQLKLAIVRPDPPSRPVMKSLLESVKTLRNADLHTEFSQGELRGKDIVSVDLSNTDLRNVKFDGAFMIETDLSGSDLGGASFAKAAIRNVTFAGAKMYGTDMTGADWFNARGLTLDQITNLKPGTVLRCPANHGTFSEAQFLQFLPRVYGYPFDTWSGDVQDQLRTVWRDYGKSGGLCHTVAH